MGVDVDGKIRAWGSIRNPLALAMALQERGVFIDGMTKEKREPDAQYDRFVLNFWTRNMDPVPAAQIVSETMPDVLFFLRFSIEAETEVWAAVRGGKVLETGSWSYPERWLWELGHQFNKEMPEILRREREGSDRQLRQVLAEQGITVPAAEEATP